MNASSPQRRAVSLAARASVEQLEGRLFLHAGHGGDELVGVLIDAGGRRALVADDGHEWSRDRHAKGGKSVAASKKMKVVGTGDDALYASYRRGKSFAYRIPVEAGNYNVTLHFTEPTQTKRNKRVFDVKAEGQTFIDDLDIVKQTGGRRRALAQAFSVTVVDGTLNLEFKARRGQAVVSAIDVIAATPVAQQPPPPQPEPQPGPQPDPQPQPNPQPNPQPQPDPVPDHGPTPVSPTIAWSSNGKMPEAMTEITAVTVGGKVYTFGGFNDIVNGWKATNAVYRFDPATAQWTRMGNMPQRLTHVGHVADDRYVYIAGGYVTENASRGWFEAYATRNVQRYDTVTDTWAALPQLPLPRAAGGLGLIGRELHWVAGSDLNQLSVTEHWALNLDDLAAGWQARAASPVGNNHFAAVSHAGALYMIAGRTGTDAAPGDISTLYRWTNDAAAPGGGTWARLADLPAARSHAAKVIHDGRLYILGGTGPNGAVYRDVYSYDFATDAWADHTDIPAPRHSGGAASAGGKIYYFGGWTYGPVANQLQNQVWVGTPG